MDCRIFSLGANDALAEKIAQTLGMPLGNVNCKSFSDGEQHVQFCENLRGKNIYLIQPTNPPAEHWVQLLLAIDAVRGASAREITAIIPYFGYARQDRKARPREPISARVFAEALESVGVDRVLTLDLHNDAIGGFFREANVDYLYARPVFLTFFQTYFKETLARDDLILVAPDAGSVVRVQSYAKRLMRSARLALIHKEREEANKVGGMRLVGDVQGKTALIIDDMADTCGTLVAAADTLIAGGAKEVYAATTHGILSGDAVQKINASPIKRFFITDTIAHEQVLGDKIEVISVGPLLGDAIRRIEGGDSLSALFEVTSESEQNAKRAKQKPKKRVVKSVRL